MATSAPAPLLPSGAMSAVITSEANKVEEKKEEKKAKKRKKKVLSIKLLEGFIHYDKLMSKLCSESCC